MSNEQNEELNRNPSKEEVKVSVIGLNKHSIRGPDKMISAFYQDTWDIIGKDI